MKKLMLVVLLCLPLLARSADKSEEVAISFDHIPVVELLTLVYGDLLKVNFVVEASVLKRKDVISVSYQTKLDRERLKDLVEQLLDDVGLIAEKRAGYVFVRPKAGDESDLEVLIYRPKHRAVSYLSGVIGSLFPSRIGGALPVAGVQAIDAGALEEGGGRRPLSLQQKAPGSLNAGPQGVLKAEVDIYTYSGSKKDVQRVQRVLQQIDTPAGEVLVKGAVYEVSDGTKSGSAVALALNLVGGRLGLNLGNKSAAGDFVTFKNANVAAVLSVLDSDNRFKSISNPSLRVVSGQHARFSVGSDVPVLGAVQFDKNGNAIQSVDYRASGVIFTLQPNVRDERIELTINQQLSNFIPTTTGVNNSPTLIKRELSTVVSSGLDDVVILGGLDESRETKETSGPAFLPSFLRTKTGESSKTQILLVLQVQKL